MMIVNCTCPHKWQDKKYGKGKRVANATDKDKVYRCVVCKTEVSTNKSKGKWER
jgi:hypothetical protein